MAAHTFPPAAQFLISYGLRLSDLSTYLTISRQYQFGIPTVFSLSPVEAAAAYGGLTIYTNDPGISGSVPGIVSTTATITGYAPDGVTIVFQRVVSRSDPGGTLVGVNWTDANGNFFANVTWEWQASVELFVNSGSALLGRFQSAVVTYVGNGAAGRLVATPFALDIGTVAVWIFPHDSGRTCMFRHNQMSGTTMAVSPASTLGGIMSFGAAGFTVTNSNTDGVFPNDNLQSYTAVVLCDTSGTPGNGLRMQLSDYAGDDTNGHLASLNSTSPTAPTMIWVFGRGGQSVFTHELFPGGGSCSTGLEAKSLTNQITGVVNVLGVWKVQLGVNNNVNNSALHYYTVSFTIPIGDPIRAIFETYAAAGSSSDPDIVSGFLFTPSFAIARPYTTNVPESVWRDPFSLDTKSEYFSAGSGESAAGLTAFGAGTLSLGSLTAPAGMTIYGWAMPLSGDVPITTDPVWAPSVPPYGSGDDDGPGGGTIPLGTLITPPQTGGPGQACRITGI